MSENTTPIEPHKTLELDTSQPSEATPGPEHKELTPAEALKEAQIAERLQKLRARDEIYAKRQGEFAKEVAYGERMQDEARATAGLAPLPHETDEIVDLGAGEAQPDAVAAPEPQRAESPVPAPQQQTAPAVPAPAAPQQLITVDVGQQRISVTPAQLMELARRGLVATHQATQQQPQYVQNQAPLYAQNQQPVGNEQRPLLTDDEAKAFHRRIAYGDSETDGAQAIRELAQTVMQRAPTPQFNPQQIAANASAQALAQISHNNNLMRIGEEFPDIFAHDANPSLWRLAAIEHQMLRQEEAATGVYRSELEAFRESAKRVRAVTGYQPQSQPGASSGNQTAPQAAPAMDQSRTERKRAAPRIPTGVSRVIPADQGPRHPTGSELVDRLRVARHQTPLH